jgi:nitrogen fixation/metabolism regulation signal transduction histidine kinase
MAMGKSLRPEKVDEYMDTINEQVQHLSRTIDDFRNFFSPSKEKKLFVPCEAVQEVYKLIEAQMMTKDIPLTIHKHNHFHVMGSPNEFKQVLLNIISNAQYAMEDKKIKNGKIDIFFETDNTFGSIRIRDNAGGISEELLPNKLFEAYITTKGNKGTGIGLQISKTIIETHMHGEISAHNIDKGAEFMIKLPLAKEPLPEQENMES